MKCPQCGTELKKAVKFCSNCGAAQGKSSAAAAPSRAAVPARPDVPDTTEPFWKPDWKWHAKALAVIFAFLAVVYVALNAFLSRVPEPYRTRDVPTDITPWLKK
jgi:uncharacterized membrane protein YvbJ